MEIDDQPVPQATSATRPMPLRSRSAMSGSAAIHSPTRWWNCGRLIPSWASTTSAP